MKRPGTADYKLELLTIRTAKQTTKIAVQMHYWYNVNIIKSYDLVSMVFH